MNALAILVLGIIAVWHWSGWKKIPIGWRALRTFLGKRTHSEAEEGWKWAAWPLGLEPIDCREIILSLGQLEATTKDNLKVFLTSTVTYRVIDLYKYLDVQTENSNIKHVIDEKRTEVLRAEIRARSLEEVLDLKKELGEIVKGAIEHEDWGLDIKHVVIPEIKPDPKTSEDLALKRREELQKEGQMVEGIHLAVLTAAIKNEAEKKGATLTDEQAYESALYITGKADPKKMYGVDAATAKVIGAILERKS